MEQITLGDLARWATFAVALGGSIAAIIRGVNKAVGKLLEPVVKQIESVDRENCKNFLVTFLAETERGQEHDQIELERFHEQFEHYKSIGGNSYIKAKVEKLKAAGKL
jgi:F0F1-type ATP synthase membrane subunit c/vacuolar-type H+-ATPase subunit K